MAVKVIAVDPTAVKRVTCRKCSSVLEYTPSDTKRRNYAYDYLGDYEIGNFVKCPTCGGWVQTP